MKMKQKKKQMIKILPLDYCKFYEETNKASFVIKEKKNASMKQK